MWKDGSLAERTDTIDMTELNVECLTEFKWDAVKFNRV